MDFKKIPMLFILGHGRSGTTLLQSLLNGHPNIIAPTEYDFIIYLYPRFGKIKHFKKKDITDFVEALFSDTKFSMWLMDEESLTEQLLDIATHTDYPSICKMLISLTDKSKEEIKILSDKNPINSLFVRKLMKIFPDAKFIHMIRDPRDSVYGHIKRLPQKNPFFLAWRWRMYNVILEKFKRRFPDKFFTIQYEHMVKDIDGTLTALFSFLDVPYMSLKKDDLVPEGFKSIDKNKFLEKLPADKKDAVLNKFKFFHESLAAPVTTANIEKWKKEMSPYDIAVTEIITGESAKKYGYAVEPINKVKISKYLLFKSRIIYFTWELFTRWRYDNYKFNTRYRAKFIRSIINKEKTE